VNLLDVIPFNESLQRDQEIISDNDQSLTMQVALFWYGKYGVANWKPIANVRDGVEATIKGARCNDLGKWQFIGSKTAQLGKAARTGSRWKNLTEAGRNRLGLNGTSSGGLPAIATTNLFNDGIFIRNDDVTVSPGRSANGSPSKYTYAVARWIADLACAGMIAVNGSILKLTANGDGVDFHILVNGVERYSVASSPVTHLLPESFFDIATVVKKGDTVDFVLGDNRGHAGGDESILRATISVFDGLEDRAAIKLQSN